MICRRSNRHFDCRHRLIVAIARRRLAPPRTHALAQHTPPNQRLKQRFASFLFPPPKPALTSDWRRPNRRPSAIPDHRCFGITTARPTSHLRLYSRRRTSALSASASGSFARRLLPNLWPPLTGPFTTRLNLPSLHLPPTARAAANTLHADYLSLLALVLREGMVDSFERRGWRPYLQSQNSPSFYSKT